MLIGLTFGLFLQTFVAQPFPDVPKEHWAYQAVEELRLAGILHGYPDGKFRG